MILKKVIYKSPVLTFGTLCQPLCPYLQPLRLDAFAIGKSTPGNVTIVKMVFKECFIDLAMFIKQSCYVY